MDRIGGEFRLHGLEDFSIDDGLMLAGTDLTAVSHVTHVETVLEKMGDGTDAKPDAADAAVGSASALGPDTTFIEVLDEGAHRSEFEIPPKNRPNCFGLFRDNYELLVQARISEGDRTPDPHPLSF